MSEHLRNIYDSGELAEGATLRKIRIVRTEGTREVARDITFYNLDAIISVGYRVNSAQATQFREQYDEFRVRQDREFETDFEAEVKRIESKRVRAGKEEP
jgi:hypothetical protein